MSLSISYIVENAGWAEVAISDGDQKIVNNVSYLHDSLRDLAELAIAVSTGARTAEATFMDEPGELLLVLHKKHNQMAFEVRWFNNWASWGLGSSSDYDVLLKGETTAEHIINQITGILTNIHDRIGPSKYKEMWGEHEFPLEQYRKLTGT
ncbi:hypothetical protein FE845_05275 [Marinobacter sp. 1-4A]|uniref:hypothetical protein n=1 Tax=unclassified Marinobacter TaxID=83889 RepID=UPI00190805BC|nr:hypothetical protein [Marinobacter sp. 1-4A]MBK1850737.1 hypothetical protein [Marinobacter sp. 1-4A]